MNGFWLFSYLVLWILVIGAALVILALAREVEALHKRIESLQQYLGQAQWGSNGRERVPAEESADQGAVARAGSDE